MKIFKNKLDFLDNSVFCLLSTYTPSHIFFSFKNNEGVFISLIIFLAPAGGEVLTLWGLIIYPFQTLRGKPNPKITGRISYTAHGAHIPSLPYFLFLFIFCFYAYFRLGMPRRVRKEVQLGPRRVRVPRRCQNQEKKRKIKNQGGRGICAPRAQYERVPISYIENLCFFEPKITFLSCKDLLKQLQNV